MLLIAGRGPVCWKKIAPESLREAPENIDEPCADVDASGLLGGEKGVCDGHPDDSGEIAGEEIGLSAEGQRTDGILGAVVVDLISAVQDIAAEPWQEDIGV